MRKPYYSSLGFRLLIIVLIAALPIFGLVLYIDADQSQKATENAETDLIRMSNLTASDMGQVVEGAHQLLLAAAQLEAVNEQDPVACSAVFTRLLIENPSYLNLSASYPNGDVYCSGVPQQQAVNLADRGHFQDALRFKQFTVGGYIISRLTGQPTIPFAFPVIDRAGNVQSVLTALLDIKRLSAYGESLDLPEGGVFNLIDSSGTILSRYPQGDEWIGTNIQGSHLFSSVISGQQRVVDIVGVDGVDRYYSYAPVDGSGDSLFVVIGIPKMAILASIQATTAQNLVIVSLISLIAILAAVSFSQTSILKPIKQLSQATQRVATGDLSSRVELKTSGELAELANSFNKMTLSLDEQTARLRQAEWYFRNLVEHIPAITYRIITTQPAQIQYVSPQVEGFLGISVEAVTQNPQLYIDAIHPEDQDRVLQKIEKMKPGDTWTLDFRMISMDGRTLWFRDEGLATADEVTGETVLHGVMINTTERQEILETLRQERDVLERLMETSPAGILVFNKQGQVVFSNQQADETLGNELALPRVSGDATLALAFDDEQGQPVPIERQPYSRVLDTEQAVIDDRLSIQAFNRGRIQLSVNAAPFRDRNGKVSGAIVTLQDITELVQQRVNMEALLNLTTTLRNTTTRTEMYSVLLSKIMDLLKFDGATLVTKPGSNNNLLFHLGLGKWAHLTGLLIAPEKSITYQVMETGEIYRNDEIQQDPDLLHIEGFFTNEVRHGVCVPLRTQSQVIGAIWVGDHAPIEERSINFLNAIADIGANAIHRAALFEQTQARLKRLSALHAVDMAITSSLDLQVTLNILLDQIIAQMNVDASDILLLNPETQMLEYAAGRGFSSPKVQQTRLHLGEPFAGEVALNRRSLLMTDVVKTTGSTFPVSSDDFLAYFAEPLIAKGQVKGVLELFHRTKMAPDQEWLEFLHALATQAAIAIDNTELFNTLQRTNDELTLAYDATIEGWSRALELRDRESEGHSERVTDLTLRIARMMGVKDQDLSHYRRGVLLHDIGKMAIPEEILMKPGPLTKDEWDMMRLHPRYAYELLYPVPFLRRAVDIPYCHHERWDGSGYPRGLRGEAIPFPARVFAVVDVWDALRSPRPYRVAWPDEQAETYLRAKSGIQFDPKVVETFFDIINGRNN
ncbi:MAG TPA: HD domain-containing phosphohydrolase [Anaerolineaceae bacterium]|nr:HD domain-containing phosphohydrolase [Anaerolineaceae bacterium]